jgi:hypothetical protein
MTSDDLPNTTPTTAEFVVIRFVDGWRVLAGKRRWGRFHYCVDAEEEALRLGASARRAGQEVRILVQGFTGELRPLHFA